MWTKQILTSLIVVLLVAPTLAQKSSQKQEVTGTAPKESTAKPSLVAKVIYGKHELTLKHAVAYQRPDKLEKDRMRTVVFFTDRPLPPLRVKKAMQKEEPTIFDFFGFGTGVPEYIKLTLNGNGYVTVSCRVKGETLNVATNKITDTSKVASGRVKGKVEMEKPIKFFDNTFQIQSSFDLMLTSNALPAKKVGQ